MSTYYEGYRQGRRPLEAEVNCARCGHPISQHTGYGGKCMASNRRTGLCTCQRPLNPEPPKEKKA